MSSRSRMMGAGNASATIYNTNVNLNTFGGNKKQGITSRVGLDNWANLAVQTYSNGFGKNKLFCMNQLGGVGAGKSMFNGRFTQTDGVHCPSVPVPVPVPSLTITLTSVSPIFLNPPMTFSSTSTNFVITIKADLIDCDPNLVTHFNIGGILYSVISIDIGASVAFTFPLPSPTLPANFTATVTCGF